MLNTVFCTSTASLKWWWGPYVHVCVYIYICINICIYYMIFMIYIYIYIPTYLPPSIRPSVRPSIHPSVRPSIHPCIHTYLPTYLPTYIHTYIHTRTHFFERHKTSCCGGEAEKVVGRNQQRTFGRCLVALLAELSMPRASMDTLRLWWPWRPLWHRMGPLDNPLWSSSPQARNRWLGQDSWQKGRTSISKHWSIY
jgi:hypothetical protein